MPRVIAFLVPAQPSVLASPREHPPTARTAARHRPRGHQRRVGAVRRRDRGAPVPAGRPARHREPAPGRRRRRRCCSSPGRGDGAWTRAELGTSLLFGAVFTAMNVCLYLAIDRLPLATVITLEFLGPLAVSLATARRGGTRVWAAAGRGRRRAARRDAVRRRPDRRRVRPARRLLLGRVHPAQRTDRAHRHRAGRAGPGERVRRGRDAAGRRRHRRHRTLLRPATAADRAAVGVLSSAIPYSLDLLALRRLPTAVFGVLTSLNPAWPRSPAPPARRDAVRASGRRRRPRHGRQRRRDPHAAAAPRPPPPQRPLVTFAERSS